MAWNLTLLTIIKMPVQTWYISQSLFGINVKSNWRELISLAFCVVGQLILQLSKKNVLLYCLLIRFHTNYDIFFIKRCMKSRCQRDWNSHQKNLCWKRLITFSFLYGFFFCKWLCQRKQWFKKWTQFLITITITFLIRFLKCSLNSNLPKK